MRLLHASRRSRSDPGSAAVGSPCRRPSLVAATCRRGKDLSFLLRFRVQLGKIILSPSLNYEQSLQFLLPYAA